MKSVFFYIIVIGGVKVWTLHNLYRVISPTYEEEACLVGIQEYIQDCVVALARIQ